MVVCSSREGRWGLLGENRDPGKEVCLPCACSGLGDAAMHSPHHWLMDLAFYVEYTVNNKQLHIHVCHVPGGSEGEEGTYNSVRKIESEGKELHKWGHRKPVPGIIEDWPEVLRYLSCRKDEDSCFQPILFFHPTKCTPRHG